MTASPSELTFEVPTGSDRARCSGCGAPIAWIITAKGHRMPISLAADAKLPARGPSHFSDCPEAGRFRKKDRQRRAGAK